MISDARKIGKLGEDGRWREVEYCTYEEKLKKGNIKYSLQRALVLKKMIQMNQFVENHIVPDEGRHLYQAPVQRDGTGAGAGAPARFLVSDAHPPGGKSMALGQAEGGLREFNLGQVAQYYLRRITRATPRFA